VSAGTVRLPSEARAYRESGPLRPQRLLPAERTVETPRGKIAAYASARGDLAQQVRFGHEIEEPFEPRPERPARLAHRLAREPLEAALGPLAAGERQALQLQIPSRVIVGAALRELLSLGFPGRRNPRARP
jgi:hypothetical protein